MSETRQQIIGLSVWLAAASLFAWLTRERRDDGGGNKPLVKPKGPPPLPDNDPQGRVTHPPRSVRRERELVGV